MSQEFSVLVLNKEEICSIKQEAKRNENEIRDLLNSEKILDLLETDFQRYVLTSNSKLSCLKDACLNSDDIGEGMKYNAYNVSYVPITRLDTLQDDDAYECEKYENAMYDEYEDSYDGIDSDFDELSVRDSCINQSTEENNESECDLPALQVLKETLFDDLNLCVQDINRSYEKGVGF